MTVYSQLKIFLSNLRACANCGQFKCDSDIHFVCHSCANIIKIASEPLERRDCPFAVNSLYNWTNKNEQAARRLILALKGRGEVIDFSFFARQLSLKFFDHPQLQLKEKIILVAAPPKIAGDIDHAANLAHAINQYLKGHIIQPFRRQNKNTQKTRNRDDRIKASENLMILDGEIIELPLGEDANVIFVDDVITTGQTALAAYNLLKRPINFSAWTIFNRPMLRC